MKIVIFGSCASRDIFRGDFVNGKNDVFVDKYFARTSLISLNSPPTDYKLPSIDQLNPFMIRLLSDDLYKRFFSHIPKKTGLFILIDFIDERFNILKSGDHYFTISNEFLKANLLKVFPGVILKRTQAETLQLWEESCLVFIQKLKEQFHPGRIIMHKALYKNQYIDSQKVYDFPNTKNAVLQNELLNKYYDFFEQNFPGIHILDLNKHDYKADKNHIWGLGEMHYQQEYYDECLRFIDNLQRKTEHNPSEL